MLAHARRVPPAVRLLVLLALGALCLAAPAAAQARTLVEDDFELGEPGTAPAGWHGPSMGPRGEVVAEDAGDGTRCARLDCSRKADRFGNLIGSTRFDLAERSRVLLHAAVRVHAGKGGRAQLWLRFDYDDGTSVLADNMHDRPLTGGDWSEARIVADVLPKTGHVVYGLMAFDGACVDLDDVRLEVLGPSPVSAEPPRALNERGLANLVAFARLFGFVRYFHPSDEAAATDWERFALDGVRRVEGAAGAEELRAVLCELFAPLAPTVVVHASGSDAQLDPALLAPPADDLARACAWRHVGMGRAEASQIYTSKRQNLRLRDGALPEGFADPARPFRAELGGGLACAVPLTLYSLRDGTLPRPVAASSPATAEEPALSLTGTLQSAYPPEDRGTRLAAVLLAWNVFQHFYPYFDVVPFDGVAIDWPAELERALRTAAEDADARAFGHTLERLVAALHDGHGSVQHVSLVPTGILPVGWVLVDGELVVTWVDSSLAGRLERGDVVLALAGRPTAEVVAELTARISAATPQFLRYRAALELLQGTAATKVRLAVRRGEASEPVELELAYGRGARGLDERDVEHPGKLLELEPGLWYVDLGAVTTDEYLEHLERLVDAEGIVFDMRGYPSGLDASALFSHLITESVESPRWLVPVLTRPDREGLEHERSSWTIEPAEPLIGAERVFLIDGRAISYAETCMGIVEHYHLGELVGEATAGTNGNVNPFMLPGGYTVSWTGMRVEKHDGSRHHGVGILPTVPVRRTRAGIAAGRDELLDAAVEYLKR